MQINKKEPKIKKIILLILSVNLLLAFPPDSPYFDKLLSDNGKIVKNIPLKIKKLDDTYSCAMIYFDGEITLTGVLERADDFETNDALRFYPDNNLGLPFLYSTSSHKIEDYKQFGNLAFGVLLDDKNVHLPEPLDKAFFGISAARAEVTIKNYHFYGEGEAGRGAYGTLVRFKLLGDIQKEYFIKEASHNYRGHTHFQKLKYTSKDDYVNIRDKPNGKIIGKILKSDMIDNKGLILLSEIQGGLSDWQKIWIRVYYLPPDAKDGKDAISGFVHGSQVNTEYDY